MGNGQFKLMTKALYHTHRLYPCSLQWDLTIGLPHTVSNIINIRQSQNNEKKTHLDRVKKVGLFCYLVLLSNDNKPK